LRSAVRVDAPNEGMRRPPVLRPFGGGHVSAGIPRTLRAGLSVWNREKGEQDHILPVKTLQTGWWYVPARPTFTWWYGPVSVRLAVSDDRTSSLLRPRHGGVLERVCAQDHEVCCGPHGDPPEVGTAEQVGIDRRGRTQRIEYAVHLHLQPHALELLVFQDAHEVGAEAHAYAGRPSDLDRSTPGVEHLVVLRHGDGVHADLVRAPVHRVIRRDRRHEEGVMGDHQPRGRLLVQYAAILTA